MTSMFYVIAGFILLTLLVGIYTYTKVKGKSVNYMVCDKTLPFIIVGTTLTAQSVDGNASLGNAMMSYEGGFWAGASIPIGLALCLLLTGRFIAPVVNRMNLLSLPDFFGRRYDKLTEFLVSIATIVSFTILLAGNLAALSWIISSLSPVSYVTALVVMAMIIFMYTIAGGLFSAVWTSFLQIYLAIFGFLLLAGWLWATYGVDSLAAVDAGFMNLSGLVSRESGALVNWASIVALAFGNMMALDFMERVFAAQSPRVAQTGCYMAAGLTVIAGIPATMIGIMAITLLGAVSEPRMVLPMLAVDIAPFAVGALALIGIVGASMSTANGAVLVTSIVLARNILQKGILNRPLSDQSVLMVTRIMAIPMTICAVLFAYIRPDPGILLVLAFDVVLAGCVVPLVGGIYWKRGNSCGALLCVIGASILRIVLHWLIPDALAGLDTFIPPVAGLVLYVVGSLAADGKVACRHHVIYQRPDEHEVLVEGTASQTSDCR